MKGPALAEAVGSTSGFVSQVLNPLVRQGWIRSDPGPSGGYSLAVGLGEVSVLAVIEAIEGPTLSGRCVLADRPCDADRHMCTARAVDAGQDAAVERVGRDVGGRRHDARGGVVMAAVEATPGVGAVPAGGDVAPVVAPGRSAVRTRRVEPDGRAGGAGAGRGVVVAGSRAGIGGDDGVRGSHAGEGGVGRSMAASVARSQPSRCSDRLRGADAAIALLAVAGCGRGG